MYIFSRDLKVFAAIGVLVISLFTLIFVFVLRPSFSLADSTPTGPLSGYAWSDTIGWISLNGSTYGLSVATNGDISGYAWSDNVGWISANTSDLSGCPSNPCRAKLNGNNLTGWLKALAGGSAQSGGWDGFISLSGSNPNYGPKFESGSDLTGYAWGSTVVGWVDFSLAVGACTASNVYTCTGSGNNTVRHTAVSSQCETTITDGPVCTSPAFCSAGSAVCLYPPIDFISVGDETGHLNARPRIVQKGLSTTLFWNIDNVTSCTVTGDDGENFPAGCSENTCSAGAGGVPTAAINQQTTFTLVCTGVDGSTLNESVIVNVVPVFQER
ncbi:hypothetical protein A3H16_03355 [Candidatus Kaiserbacteria bacterium RIFCSPLOWO2_12_FULL_53_8]|uniref:Uncharacterized protein n=2 Tax=Candidatus Kaiseribacteriota TaxID=1752734 RepID=A0A1F6CW83_9BACT|nr:MAG: hypothetical protein A2851_05630 [Candidatus Kaiserbacteria bacterium RIFCSPHIGHO2_01_FULL_53_29]OGG91829.1 MAG: hypothetical protein A3H16_03355 [Candidatus Kaiserbacteria bacterium RIFCSPLOWO2_12_FULL_53_8]